MKLTREARTLAGSLYDQTVRSLENSPQLTAREIISIATAVECTVLRKLLEIPACIEEE